MSTFPQYPAAGPFTHLIYKNISIPVYSTLKGVRRKQGIIIVFIFLTDATVNLFFQWKFWRCSLVIFKLKIFTALLTAMSVFSESHTDQQCSSPWWRLWLRGWQQLAGQPAHLNSGDREEGQYPRQPSCCEERWRNMTTNLFFLNVFLPISHLIHLKSHRRGRYLLSGGII